jgi:hypothetical protein
MAWNALKDPVSGSSSGRVRLPAGVFGGFSTTVPSTIVCTTWIAICRLGRLQLATIACRMACQLDPGGDGEAWLVRLQERVCSDAP